MVVSGDWDPSDLQSRPTPCCELQAILNSNLKVEVHSLTSRRSYHPVYVRDGKKFVSMLEKRYGGLNLHGLGVKPTHGTVGLSLLKLK